MIPIKVSNNQQQRYVTLVGNAILAELDGLRIAVDHLMGNNVIAHGHNFTKYKRIATAMVNMVVKPAFDTNKFNQPNYVNTIQEYRAGTQQIPQNVLDNIILFVNYFTGNNGKNLNSLLLCPSNDLKDTCEKLETQLNVRSNLEKKIAELIFDYGNCEDVVLAMKNFFRSEKLVLVCPYCNLHKANYISGEQGGTAEVHELDHYFEKAGHRILSYSLFNLVPSDGHCNASYNKGSHIFTKKYHLNPHEGGYCGSLRFKAVGDGTNVSRLEPEIVVKPGDPLFDKMLGLTGKFDDSSKSGNLNVFKIRARYNDLMILRDVAKIAKKVSEQASRRRHIISFITRMGKNVNSKVYKDWYESNLMTFFEQDRFSEAVFSKLYRDVHDHIFLTDKHFFNRDIRKLINDNPQSD
jgi:hypothetical protein